MHRRMLVIGLMLGALVVAGTARADEKKEKPDGTIEFSGGTVAAGIGYSWGSGDLSYKGKKHAIKIDGLSVGSVGAAKITLSGKVYHLNKLEDFDGNYTGVGAGATVGGGGSVLTMRNQNGVVIEAHSTTQGLSLTLGAGGADIKLKK
jgi:type 1 fimbria pilin